MLEKQLVPAENLLQQRSNMGKKRIIQKTEKELLAERDRIDKALKKEIRVKAPSKIKQGRVYIYSTYNNTILSLTDSQGNVLAWVSAGSLGFKGTKKSTPFAASKVAELLVSKASKIGVDKVKIFVRGVGSGRSSALRSLAAKGLDITAIEDITPIPHNGCRPPKPRRT